MHLPFPIDEVRDQFPGLTRQVAGGNAVFFDGPAGSQVPERVANAVSHCLLQTNANTGGVFATSREADAMREKALQALADFLGAPSAREVIVGANMTSLTLALARSLARTWGPGDEVVVTRLDHDANVTPWLLAARDSGATVLHVEIMVPECRLHLDDLRQKLSPRTRLVAVGAASNLAGTINPVREMVTMAHSVGAEVFVDAVHMAPHRRIDVRAWDCDYLACSPYKFFGPHAGVLWGRAERLLSLPAYQVRPAPKDLPGRWMTGTANVEGMAGALAAVDYLAWLGQRVSGAPLTRRAALDAAFNAIAAYEEEIFAPLLSGLQALPGITLWGITDPERLAERTPTIALTHRSRTPTEIARHLAERGFFVWPGNSYALGLTEALGLEPEGVLRIGLVHYNTAQEVRRLLEALGDYLG